MRSRLIIGMSLCLLPVSLFAQKAIDDFWSYIKARESKIYTVEVGDKSLAAEMHEQIALINPDIGVFYGERNGNKRTLVITAGGNPGLFELADTIVSRSPGFDRLKPVSLFPPTEVTEPFVAGDIRLLPSQVHYLLTKEGDKYTITFVLEGEHNSRIQDDKSGQIYDLYLQMLYSMTMQVLGERLIAQKIGNGDIAAVNMIPLPKNIKYLLEEIKASE